MCGCCGNKTTCLPKYRMHSLKILDCFLHTFLGTRNTKSFLHIDLEEKVAIIRDIYEYGTNKYKRTLLSSTTSPCSTLISSSLLHLTLFCSNVLNVLILMKALLNLLKPASQRSLRLQKDARPQNHLFLQNLLDLVCV